DGLGDAHGIVALELCPLGPWNAQQRQRAVALEEPLDPGSPEDRFDVILVDVALLVERRGRQQSIDLRADLGNPVDVAVDRPGEETARTAKVEAGASPPAGEELAFLVPELAGRGREMGTEGLVVHFAPLGVASPA